MPSGFGNDPVGLDDDDPATDATEPVGSTLSKNPVDDRVRVALGIDNPFFDFRWRGDPGGVGYYKMQTQVQFLDSTTTGLSLDLEAVTPAGLESDGVAGGPTVLRPALAYSKEVAEGTAIHGFVGKRIDNGLRARGGTRHGLQYGLALESPLPGLDLPSNHAVHWFVETIAHHPLPDSSQATAAWKVLPGLHWRVGETWWMSGGLSVPVGPVRPDSRLWQITCSWQF